MSTHDTAPRILNIESAPQWLRHSEAAAYARVSTRTIRRWAALGLIRATKPAGGRSLVSRDSLRAFVEGGASTAA